jgi:hypothetical protein
LSITQLALIVCAVNLQQLGIKQIKNNQLGVFLLAFFGQSPACQIAEIAVWLMTRENQNKVLL